MTKTFRVQYKTIGLTYSRCPLDKKTILENLQKKLTLDEYYIVQEEHKDEKNGTKYHIHAWFSLCSKPNIVNCKYFDIDGYHPNVGKYKKSWVHNYLKKFDKEPLTNLSNGYVGLAKQGKLVEAMELFAALKPAQFVINYERIKKHMKMMSRKRVIPHTHPLDTFKTQLDLSDWDCKKQSLVIVGRPGTGKTSYMRSYITNVMKKKFLYVTHIDTLKKFDETYHEVILYDDVDFKHLPRTTQIHIAEPVIERQIHCRHSCADIPYGITSIFTTNYFPFTEDEAILRRVLTKYPCSFI